MTNAAFAEAKAFQMAIVTVAAVCLTAQVSAEANRSLTIAESAMKTLLMTVSRTALECGAETPSLTNAVSVEAKAFQMASATVKAMLRTFAAYAVVMARMWMVMEFAMTRMTALESLTNAAYAMETILSALTALELQTEIRF